MFSTMKPSDWDKTASEYAANSLLGGPMTSPLHKLLSTLNHTSPFSSATSILDVGAGPGNTIAQLISTFGSEIPSSAHLVASDFSPGMVSQLSKNKEERIGTDEDKGRCWTRLETMVLDAMNLEGVPDGSVSHVVGNMVYYMLHDPKKGLEAAWRVLADGGVLGFTSLKQAGWMDVFQIAARNVVPGKDAGFDPKTLGRWSSTEGLKLELEDVGFKDMHVEEAEVVMAMSKPEMFVNNFFKSSNPGAKLAVRNLSTEELDRVCDEWIRLVGEQGNEVKGRLIIAIGRK